MMTGRTTDLRLLLPAAPEAAAAARDALKSFEGQIDDEVVESLRLVASELVTNSYRHAGLGPGQRIEVRARVRDGSIRLEVQDPGRGFVPPEEPNPQQDSGWGLYLVDQIADRWGVTSDEVTCVWAEIDTR